MFSQIVIARILYYRFLNEAPSEDNKLPITMLRLLEAPCQHGHPVAIRFYNELLGNVGTSAALDMRRDDISLSVDVLYDYKTRANMQIGQ